MLVGAEDFTVRGGSIGLGAADKRHRLTQIALEEGVPLIFMLHGAGHRVVIRQLEHTPLFELGIQQHQPMPHQVISGRKETRHYRQGILPNTGSAYWKKNWPH